MPILGPSSFPARDENIVGPLLPEDTGLPRLRTACPHFGRWMTRLEQLDAPAEAH